MSAIKKIFLAAAMTASAFMTAGASGTVRDSVLVIPASATEIKDYEYADRTDFNRIDFSAAAKLVRIGSYAFMGCTELKETSVPEGVTEVGEGCFRECTALERITFPESLTKLPKAVCIWDGALKNVRIGSRTKDIGSHAFAYCSSLEKFDFPSGLLHIGSNVFSLCGRLKEAVLPASIKELESYAFSECVSLERAVLPANGALLGELIFSGCRSLRSLTENSPKVPEFDCNSFPAEPDDEEFYSRCVLYVPARLVNAYSKAPGWRLFKNIIGK